MFSFIHRFAFFAALLIFLQQTATAQVYFPDSTFATNGTAIPNGYSYPLGATSHQAKKVIVQPDGKILLIGAVGGQTPVEIVRLNANGSVDATFGVNGYYQGYGHGGGQTLIFADAALAPDGKILVCYQAVSTSLRNALLYRINANGSADNTFASGGQLTITNGAVSWVSKIMYQADGKAVLGGAKNLSQPVNLYALYRINQDGSLDNTFGTAGKIENVYAQFASLYTVASALTPQPDGKILMFAFVSPVTSTGATSAAIRFRANGTVDSTFGVNGCRMIDSLNILPQAITMDSLTGDIYLFGVAGATPTIAKLAANGSVVTSFGTNGHVAVNTVIFSQTQGVYSYPISMIRQRDGKFLFAGISDTSSTSHTVACRLNANGQADNTFCNNGVLSIPRSVRDVHMSAAVQADGDLLFAGTTYGRMANRFPWDTTYMYCMRFTDKPKVITPPQSIRTTARAAGKVHVYPNPSVGGAFVLQYDGVKQALGLRLKLYDVTGRLSAAQSYPTSSSNGEVLFTPSHHLPAGMYLLHVANGDEYYPVVKVMVE